MPFVPAGELSEPSLPDRENWVTALWISAFKRINNNAKAAFSLVNRHRFIEPPSNRAPDIEDMNEKNLRSRILKPIAVAKTLARALLLK